MILPFSTQTKNGTKTHFVEKIWAGLLSNQIFTNEEFVKFFNAATSDERNFLLNNWEPINNMIPKITTIREDIHDRWHAGRLIHPVINNRSKNQFQFAPVFPCVSTQKIEIINRKDYQFVATDGRVIYEAEPMGFYLDQTFKDLIKNDGFNSLEAFWNWFDHDFKGKIIHWTSLKY
jgi:hypothetical protein